MRTFSALFSSLKSRLLRIIHSTKLKSTYTQTNKKNILIHHIIRSALALLQACSNISMVLRKKGQFEILVKSQTICTHSNSLGKKGQSTKPNCINCFGRSYWEDLCSLSSHISLFYPKNLNACKQFNSSSKCQIGPFCATPSNDSDGR